MTKQKKERTVDPRMLQYHLDRRRKWREEEGRTRNTQGENIVFFSPGDKDDKDKFRLAKVISKSFLKRLSGDFTINNDIEIQNVIFRNRWHYRSPLIKTLVLKSCNARHAVIDVNL